MRAARKARCTILLHMVPIGPKRRGYQNGLDIRRVLVSSSFPSATPYSFGASPEVSGIFGKWCAMPLWQSMQVNPACSPGIMTFCAVSDIL